MVPAGERGHGLVGRALVALLVVAVLLGGVAAWRLDLVGRLTDDDPSAGTPAGPAAIEPPPGPRAARADRAHAGRHAGDPARPDRPGPGAGRRGAVPRRPVARPARRGRRRRPHRRPAGREARGRRGHDAGVDHQAADGDRGAVGARTGDPVHDPRGRRWQEADRAGRRRRPVPVLEAAARGVPRPRRPADPRRPDRGRAAAAGADLGAARLRRLPLLRAVVQPGLAGALPARARGLAGHRALGGRGPARRRLRAGRRPVAVRRADVRHRLGRPRHHRGRRADPRRRVRRARAGVRAVGPAPRDRRAGPRGERQRGGRGALAPGREGGVRQRDVRRRGRGGHPDARRASGSPPTSPSTTAAACPARTGSRRWRWCRCSGWPSTPRIPS